MVSIHLPGIIPGSTHGPDSKGLVVEGQNKQTLRYTQHESGGLRSLRWKLGTGRDEQLPRGMPKPRAVGRWVFQGLGQNKANPPTHPPPPKKRKRTKPIKKRIPSLWLLFGMKPSKESILRTRAPKNVHCDGCLELVR